MALHAFQSISLLLLSVLLSANAVRLFRKRNDICHTPSAFSPIATGGPHLSVPRVKSSAERSVQELTSLSCFTVEGRSHIMLT